MEANYKCKHFPLKQCGNCKHGSLINGFDLTECAIYDDLMFNADVCPLWE